jgi:hypothetical protein
MHFHIVKKYKDKEVKNVKDIFFVNVWRKNIFDILQAFLKKWWVESDFKAPNLPLSLRFKAKDTGTWNIE